MHKIKCVYTYFFLDFLAWHCYLLCVYKNCGTKKEMTKQNKYFKYFLKVNNNNSGIIWGLKEGLFIHIDFFSFWELKLLLNRKYKLYLINIYIICYYSYIWRFDNTIFN